MNLFFTNIEEKQRNLTTTDGMGATTFRSISFNNDDKAYFMVESTIVYLL